MLMQLFERKAFITNGTPIKYFQEIDQPAVFSPLECLKNTIQRIDKIKGIAYSCSQTSNQGDSTRDSLRFSLQNMKQFIGKDILRTIKQGTGACELCYGTNPQIKCFLSLEWKEKKANGGSTDN